MSIISAVSSGASAEIYQLADSGNGAVSTPQNLASLGVALESGDLSRAQSALTALSVGGTGVQPFGSNVVADADYDSVVGAVDSGNFSAAEVAYSSLQTAVDTAGSAHAESGLGRIISSAYIPHTPPTPPGEQLEITV